VSPLKRNLELHGLETNKQTNKHTIGENLPFQIQSVKLLDGRVKLLIETTTKEADRYLAESSIIIQCMI